MGKQKEITELRNDLEVYMVAHKEVTAANKELEVALLALQEENKELQRQIKTLKQNNIELHVTTATLRAKLEDAEMKLQPESIIIAELKEDIKFLEDENDALTLRLEKEHHQIKALKDALKETEGYKKVVELQDNQLKIQDTYLIRKDGQIEILKEILMDITKAQAEDALSRLVDNLKAELKAEIKDELVEELQDSLYDAIEDMKDVI